MIMANLSKILHLNKIGLIIVAIIALTAMFFTLFFALQGGVRSYKTILLRTGISFVFFSIIGYFVAFYLEKFFLSNLQMYEQATNQVESDKEDNLSIKETSLDDEKDLETEADSKENAYLEDDSFDKIVIVNKDSDN